MTEENQHLHRNPAIKSDQGSALATDDKETSNSNNDGITPATDDKETSNSNNDGKTSDDKAEIDGAVPNQAVDEMLPREPFPPLGISKPFVKEKVDLVQHKSMYWVSVPVGEETLDLDDSKVVEEHGVPKEVIFKFVAQEMEKETACLSLPFALALLLVYGMCYQSHNNALVIGDVENAISTDLHENAVFAYTDPGWMAHKDLSDVHNAQDIWSWLRIGLSPLLFKQFRIWSELTSGAPPWPEISVPKQEKPVYLQYNRLIGGLQLSQVRGQAESCPNEDLAHAFHLSCAPGADLVHVNLNLEPEPFEIKQAQDAYRADPELSIFIFAGEETNNVELRLRQLELSNWIDNSTVQVAAHFMTYNAHFDTLTQTSSMFFFSRSGKLWKIILHSSFVLSPYANMSLLFLDVGFVCMIFSVFLTECKEIRATMRFNADQRRCLQKLNGYFNRWNFIDWMCILLGICITVLWTMHTLSLDNLKRQLMQVSPADAKSAENVFEQMNFEMLMKGLFEEFREVHRFYYGGLRIVSGWFPVVLAVRLFKAFNAQPKLALFSRTMQRAAKDLFHFGLVMMTTFTAFTMVAHVLFGRDLLKFRTFGLSFLACFAALMGDFDLAEMKQSGRIMSMLWFISFQVVMVLILLNMLIAIIMDIYTDGKSHVHDKENIDIQLRKLWRRWLEKRAGTRIPLRRIARALLRHDRWTKNASRRKLMLREGSTESVVRELKMSARASTHGFFGISVRGSCDGDSQIFTVDDFVNAVRGLQSTQAHRLMLGAVQDFRFNHETAMTLSEAVLSIGDIKNQITSVLQMERTEQEELAELEQYEQTNVNEVEKLQEALNMERTNKVEVGTTTRPQHVELGGLENWYDQHTELNLGEPRGPPSLPSPHRAVDHQVNPKQSKLGALIKQVGAKNKMAKLQAKQDLCLRKLDEVAESHSRLEALVETRFLAIMEAIKTSQSSVAISRI